MQQSQIYNRSSLRSFETSGTKAQRQSATSQTSLMFSSTANLGALK
jgi:hypothetical protein